MIFSGSHWWHACLEFKHFDYVIFIVNSKIALVFETELLNWTANEESLWRVGKFFIYTGFVVSAVILFMQSFWDQWHSFDLHWLFSPLAIDTEVNNKLFTYILKQWDNSAQKWWFLTRTVANDYNFGVHWPNGRGRRFFLPTNKTFEGICLALAGKFLQEELRILLVFKIILWKRLLNLVLSLYMNKSTK